MSNISALTFQQGNKKGKPNDDYYCMAGRVFAVADGVSRTPYSKAQYPATSQLAAAIFCIEVTCALEKGKAFEQAFAHANGAIVEMNKAKGITPETLEYLLRDYVSCMGVAGMLSKEVQNRFSYGYVGDCGILVYGADGLPIYMSENDVFVLETFREQRGFATQDERRIWWRHDMRNRPDARYMTYGALTGELEALSYLRTGFVDLQPGDIVILFSDGMYPFLFDRVFLKLVADMLSYPFEQEGKRQAIAGYLSIAEKDLRERHVGNLDDDRTMITFTLR